MKKTILSLMLLACFYLGAQEANLKFGKVSKEEVAQAEHPLEAEAEAAILFKKEHVNYDYQTDNGFMTNRYVHYRIKIYDKTGTDWGTIQIPLYTSKNGEERVSGIKGFTYNLVGGKVEETKLKKEGIFKENVSKFRNKVSLVMPEVKAGSVIEVEYKITSDFAGNIDDFQFQYGIPVDRVDVALEIPQYYFFKKYARGFYPIDVKQSKKSRSLSISYRKENDPGRLNGGKRTSTLDFMENVYHVKAQNIPSLKEVDYTDNINNYRSAIKFELASTQFPNSSYKNYSLTWEDVAKSIYDYDDFGNELKKTRAIKGVVATLKAQSQSDADLAASIFEYVKQRMTWNNYYGVGCDKGLNKAHEEKIGNVADINLMLTAMLRLAGFDANPVLVSTKSHGIPLFPTREGFNYVVAALQKDNTTILMDATEKMAPIGVLPTRVLNWTGRLLRADGSSEEINLLPQKVAKRSVFVNATIAADGAVAGKIREQLTGNFAFNYRNSHKDDAVEAIMDQKEQKYLEMEVNDLEIKNQKECAKPLLESCSFSREGQVEIISGKMYFNPALFMTLSENPFKLEERAYPVDFKFPQTQRLTFNFKIPEGYQVESLPENTSVGLPDDMGVFKYMIQQSGNLLQFNCTTEIKSAIIPPNYYLALKEFYNQMVIKQQEKVVLSKA